MEKIDETEIILNELNGQNDWFELSRRILPKNILYKFRNNIFWDVALSVNNIDNELIKLLLEEKIINENSSIPIKIELSEIINDRELIFKYKDCLILNIILKYNKFTLKEISKLKKIQPQINMGATISYGSDSYPYTITKIISDIKIEIKRDNVESELDENGKIKYVYIQNKNAIPTIVTLRRDGKWKIQNSTIIVNIGHKEYNQDPSF